MHNLWFQQPTTLPMTLPKEEVYPWVNELVKDLNAPVCDDIGSRALFEEEKKVARNGKIIRWVFIFFENGKEVFH